MTAQEKWYENQAYIQSSLISDFCTLDLGTRAAFKKGRRGEVKGGFLHLSPGRSSSAKYRLSI